MAGNQLKSKKTTPKKAKSADLKKDKEADVKVKELVKDERTHKVLGVLCLLVAAYLFVAFTSYLFTWQQDQDKVFQYSAHMLFMEDLHMENLLGRLGAFLSHLFFFNGVGLTAFLFCYFFFIIGINFMAGRKVFPFWRNLRYILFSIIFFSTTLAFIFQHSDFAWGGALGNMVSNWLTGFISIVGTALLLIAIAISFLIWKFNFDFNKMTAKKKTATTPAGLNADSQVTEDEDNTTSSGNVLKKPSVISVTEASEEETEEEEMQLIEKEEAPKKSTTVIQPKQPKPRELGLDIPEEEKPGPDEEPVLEINPAKEDEDETPVKKPPVNAAPYEPSLDLRDYKYPELELLQDYGHDRILQDNEELEKNKHQIVTTLKNYDISIQKIFATVGPTVTLYEIVPAAGVRISKIKNLEDDIALSLAALGIRIIAPIPGRGTIGIEVPNEKKTIVSMRTLLSSEKFQNNKMNLPIAIGKKIDNENFIVDLSTMPHLLMAGATGQGKSVGINALLVSLLYKKHPSQLKFVLVDPKKVELSLYRLIEKHFLAKLPDEEEAIITDTKKVVHTLNALCIEMDLRYDLLKEAGVRNIKEYNHKFINRRLNPEKGHQFMPFIVLVVDEFADLIMTAGKEIEMPIARLAQLARAVGIHLIIATQRPSVNIITGTIKANFPARIAFKVSSKVDSRTILDVGGAEQLIGKGDMLISYNGELVRLQCAFVDTPEVEQIVDFIGNQRGYPSAFKLPEYVDDKDADGKALDPSDRDELFEDAARIIVQNQQGSTSLLQRRMKLGYNRAGRIMDQLEAAGIVGPNLGSKAREVLVKTEAELNDYLL